MHDVTWNDVTDHLFVVDVLIVVVDVDVLAVVLRVFVLVPLLEVVVELELVVGGVAVASGVVVAAIVHSGRQCGCAVARVRHEAGS